MLPLQFLSQNLHFAISLFAALICFAVFWLYFDAWLNRRQTQGLLKWTGFLLLTFSFLITGTIIEQSTLGQPLLGDKSELFSIILRVVGYIAIILAQIIDPLQPVPNPPLSSKHYFSSGAIGTAPIILQSTLPLGAAISALLYWRRATTGFERHLKPIAAALFVLSLFEAISLTHLLRDNTNPLIHTWVAPFGPIWYLEQLLLFLAMLILGRWVWGYLTKRFQSQLFMVYTSTIMAIFLLTTVSFTFLLLRNIQQEALNNLSTAAGVLEYAIGSKKAETRANAELVASSEAIIAAVTARAHNQLIPLTNDFLVDKKQSLLLITDDAGQVLLRGEDTDRWGDSLSSDPLVQQALIKKSSSSIISQDDVLAPRIVVASSTPVLDRSGRVIGSVTVGVNIDNAFVDSIKTSTGLDSAIYGGNTRSATTLLAPDGKSRWTGLKEETPIVKTQVLEQGKAYQGAVSLSNQPHLVVYTPLKDINNTVVGMLLISRPQSSILLTAGRSIELTVTVAAVLLLLAIIPAYLIARQLAKQME